jgi:hypothetical protein
VTRREPAEKVVKDILRATRKHRSSEEKIRILLEGLRGEEPSMSLARSEAVTARVGPGLSQDWGGRIHPPTFSVDAVMTARNPPRPGENPLS